MSWLYQYLNENLVQRTGEQLSTKYPVQFLTHFKSLSVPFSIKQTHSLEQKQKPGADMSNRRGKNGSFLVSAASHFPDAFPPSGRVAGVPSRCGGGSRPARDRQMNVGDCEGKVNRCNPWNTWVRNPFSQQFLRPQTHRWAPNRSARHTPPNLALNKSFLYYRLLKGGQYVQGCNSNTGDTAVLFSQ